MHERPIYTFQVGCLKTFSNDFLCQLIHAMATECAYLRELLVSSATATLVTKDNSVK